MQTSSLLKPYPFPSGVKPTYSLIKYQDSHVAKALLDYWVHGRNFSCNVLHRVDKAQSCGQRQVVKTLGVFLSLLKINIPIHVIPFLLFKLKELRGRPLMTLAKLLVNIMKSMLFLTSFVSSIHIL